jgi:hypothetical protein
MEGTHWSMFTLLFIIFAINKSNTTACCDVRNGETDVITYKFLQQIHPSFLCFVYAFTVQICVSFWGYMATTKYEERTGKKRKTR